MDGHAAAPLGLRALHAMVALPPMGSQLRPCPLPARYESPFPLTPHRTCKRAGANYGPAPDLDHANPELRAALKDWMGWLQHDIGFQGWRFDFVKGWV